MDKNIIFKNSKDEWYTPKKVVDYFQEYKKFDLDAASNEFNKKRLGIPNIYTKEHSALENHWFGKVWCNPPFSLKKQFVKKTLEEIKIGRVSTVIMLLPMSFETRIWHESIFPYISSIYIPKGRISFENENGKVATSPAFGSCIVEFSNRYSEGVKLKTIENF